MDRNARPQGTENDGQPDARSPDPRDARARNRQEAASFLQTAATTEDIARRRSLLRRAAELLFRRRR